MHNTMHTDYEQACEELFTGKCVIVLTQKGPPEMELETMVYSEGRTLACVLAALLLYCICAYKSSFCWFSIMVGLVFVWSCINDKISVMLRSFSVR